MKCCVVITACLFVLTDATAAHAAGRNDEIEAHALESSRAASRAIFAVQREERSIAETSPLRANGRGTPGPVALLDEVAL